AIGEGKAWTRARLGWIGYTVLLDSVGSPPVTAAGSLQYAFDDFGRIVAVTTELGTTRYKFFDSGSIEEMVDPAGWRYSFAEGTVPAALATASPNFLPSLAETVSSPLDQSADRFAYAGFLYDRELGLFFPPRGCLYDRGGGVSPRADPHQVLGRAPPSLHRYVYGRANPARFIDPSGHSDEEANRLAAAMHG